MPTATSIRTLRTTGRVVRRQVQRWVTQAAGINPTDLSGACAIASYALHRALKQKGIESQIGIWDSGIGPCHCWVEVGNTVVDLTATQFGEYPPVLILELEDYNVVPLWDGVVIRGDSRSKRVSSHLSRWWFAQRASKYRHRVDQLLKRM